MRRRPWTLIVLAGCHILAPIGNIIFNALLADKNVGAYFQKSLSLPYLQANWPMILAPLVAGVAIYACKKWSFYVYLMAITVLFISSYQGYLSKSGAISLAPVLFVYAINVLIVVYFLIPAVRNIYFDKRMRWWEVKPRYRCDYKAAWNFLDDKVVHVGHISNISVDGLFLKSDIMPKDEDVIQIQVPFSDKPSLEVNGQVVFHSKANTIGFGVQIHHDKDSKKMTTLITKELEERGQRVGGVEVRPEDSFRFWVRTLLTTGKGILPRSSKRQ